jgi:hypothetical protein
LYCRPKYKRNSKKTKLYTQNIVGIADYGNNPDSLPVVVKLETTTADDIFVGFNRVRGINFASKDAIDQVTVVKQGLDGKGYSSSDMLAILSNGQSHTIRNWQGSGKSMMITVKNIHKDKNPWSAEVEFDFDNASSSNTPAPTHRPTSQPTKTPVRLLCHVAFDRL